MIVVGLGQPSAGDDAVGCVVAQRLLQDPPPGWDVHVLRDAAPLVDWLDGRDVVLVDAVAGESPGSLHWLAPEQLASMRAWSTHGLGVAQAIGLAQAIHGEQAIGGLKVLGVGIEVPRSPCIGLSSQVEAAIAPAIHSVRERCAAITASRRGA